MNKLKQQQFLFMQVDQRFIQGIQSQNMTLRQEVGRLGGSLKSLEEKYQKSLKQMSSIIHANQNLKQQLDNIKVNAKNQIQNSIKQVKISYEKRIEQLMKEKNDLNLLNQSLSRQKEQNQRELTAMERNNWEIQSLKKQIAALKKENEKLLLQTHPLTQNQDNPEQKTIQSKLTQRIQQLNNKIAELNVQNSQSKKGIQALQTQNQRLQNEVQSMNKKNMELSAALEKATVDQIVQEGQNATKAVQSKSNQMEIMEMRKRNAELVNQVERMRLQKMELTSEVNKNEAQINLLGTLKSLHSQLQPMRYEIEELKRDKYFDRQNTNKEKADLQMKLLSSQHELESLKQFTKDLQTKNRELHQQIREKQWQKYKFQEIEEEKRILQGRVIVYEAMEMVSKNREKPQHVERIEEFERRIHLLLEEENLQYLVNNANVHQLIAMKAYVIELDNKLQIVLGQNEHLNKKYAQYKDKYQQLATDNKKIINKHYSMINAYKGKLQGYEKLIIKLTEELQRFIKDNQGDNIQSHYKSVITLYESKILSIHNEINVRKQENRELQKKIQNTEMQMRGKLDLIRQLEIEVSNARAQNKDLNTKILIRQSEDESRISLNNQIPEDHYKLIINEKTKQILDLEDQLSKMRFNLDKLQFDHDRQLEGHKHKISRLQIQIEQLRLQQSQSSKQLSNARNSEEVNELMHKISMLEKNITLINRTDNNADLQRQFQIQMNRLKEEARRNNQQIQIRIIELEAELKSKTRQLNRHIEQSNITINSQIHQQQHSLQQENARLKAELQKIRGSYRSITQESEGLMRKIRDTENYILSLKDDFNAVSIKMVEYEKEISVKDSQVHQWKLKFSNLQQQFDELKSSKAQVNPAVNRELNQKQKYFRQLEDEIARQKRQIDSKLRDIERRQLQVTRRETESDSKGRQLVDRLRKIEERQRIVNSQESRLIQWANELQKKDKDLQQSPARLIKTYSQMNIESNREQLQELQRKIKKLEIDLEERNKVISLKDEKLEKLIREKAELTRQFEDLSFNNSDKLRFQENSDRQVTQLKQQVSRLQEQLAKLWRDYDFLKQQHKNKQRQIDDIIFERDELKRKYEIETRQLNSKIKENQLQIQGLEKLRAQQLPNKGVNVAEIEREWEDRLRQVEERNRAKIKQLYNANEDSIRELQETISQLTIELNKYKIFGANDNKNEIQTHMAAIASLENHISSLKREVQNQKFTIQHLQQQLGYYKDLIGQRDQQILRLHENAIQLPISNDGSDQTQLTKLRNQILSLQTQLQTLQNRTIDVVNHDECVRKEHLLRMEIERLSGILQSKQQNKSEKSQKQDPQSPRSQQINDYLYLNELQQAKRQLEEDLAMARQRLMAGFDVERSIDEYLAILVITFAEVDALRQRVYELQQNFKEEHEREVDAFKKLNDLQDHELDIQKILAILKELQDSHRAFHEQEERSRSTYVKRINTEVLATQGSQLSNTKHMTFLQNTQGEMSGQNLVNITDRSHEGEGSIKSSHVQQSSSLGLSSFAPSLAPTQNLTTNQFNLPSLSVPSLGLSRFDNLGSSFTTNTTGSNFNYNVTSSQLPSFLGTGSSLGTTSGLQTTTGLFNTPNFNSYDLAKPNLVSPPSFGVSIPPPPSRYMPTLPSYVPPPSSFEMSPNKGMQFSPNKREEASYSPSKAPQVRFGSSSNFSNSFSMPHPMFR